MELGVGIIPYFLVPKNVADTVYNWLTKYSVFWSSAKLLSGSSLSKLYIAQLCQRKILLLYPVKITETLMSANELSKGYFIKKKSVKELLLSLVLNEPTQISKLFAISVDTSCPHFFLHNLQFHDGSPSAVEPVCPDDFGKLIFILFRE